MSEINEHLSNSTESRGENRVINYPNLLKLDFFFIVDLQLSLPIMTLEKSLELVHSVKLSLQHGKRTICQ